MSSRADALDFLRAELRHLDAAVREQREIARCALPVVQDAARERTAEMEARARAVRDAIRVVELGEAEQVAALGAGDDSRRPGGAE